MMKSQYGTARFENGGGILGDERSLTDVGGRIAAKLVWGVALGAVVATLVMDDGFGS
jgi:hypothetical protein